MNFKEKSVGWSVRLGKRERNSDDPLVLSVEEIFYVEIDLEQQYRLKSFLVFKHVLWKL